MPSGLTGILYDSEELVLSEVLELDAPAKVVSWRFSGILPGYQS